MAKSVAGFRNGPAGYLHTGDNSDVVSQRPMHNVKYENTYRSEPTVDFPYLGARAIIRDVLQTTFAETTKYDPLTVSQLASDAANELKNRVKVCSTIYEDFTRLIPKTKAPDGKWEREALA